jgi:hypothetical protein
VQTYNDWTKKHPFNTWSQSSLDHACLFEYAELHNEQILKALRKIDRARQNLIQAQNELAHLVYNFNNPYTARMFEAFYLRGGVTAAEWKAFFKEHDGRWVEEDDPAIQVPKRKIPEGRTHQLRVVPK